MTPTETSLTNFWGNHSKWPATFLHQLWSQYGQTKSSSLLNFMILYWHNLWMDMLRALRLVCSILDRRSSVMPQQRDFLDFWRNDQHNQWHKDPLKTFCHVENSNSGCLFVLKCFRGSCKTRCCFQSASQLKYEVARRKHHTAFSQDQRRLPAHP